jgi:hypothetical protein
MSWNYRLMRTWHQRPKSIGGGQEEIIAIHEVFYNDKTGKPDSYSFRPSWPQGENLAEFLSDLENYRLASQQPVLEATDFPAATSGNP